MSFNHELIAHLQYTHTFLPEYRNAQQPYQELSFLDYRSLDESLPFDYWRDKWMHREQA
jgi:hypothetical protein